MPVTNSNWAELSWKELAERLRELLGDAGDRATSLAATDPTRLAHELRVHQIELEMQNRQLREVQRALEASRDRYAELFDRAPIGYATLDPHGVIVEINLTGAATLRQQRERLRGIPFGLAARARDRVAFLSFLRHVSIERSKQTADCAIDGSDGVSRVLQILAMADVSPTGERLGFFVTMIDVTEMRRAEADLATLESERRARTDADVANRIKDRFLGMVSHEMRTPLNTILGWTHLLRARGTSDPQVARALDAVERNARGLARIVEDILDLSRVAHGKFRMDKKPTDLCDVVQGALESAAAAARAKPIALRVDVGDPAAVCAIEGDASRLEQVVSNLLSNAIKFTPAGGVVELRLVPDVDGVTLVVSDNGDGIEASVLPHVFENFRQADDSSTRASGGLGLGLAIASHIVEAHGGTIVATSDGQGRGATFTVRLPRGAVADAAPQHDSLAPHGQAVSENDGAPTPIPAALSAGSKSLL